MKIDFHFHAALSKKIGFELDFFRTTLQQARQVGLDALAVTEHFNSSNIDVLYPTLDAEFEYVGDYYLADGIKLFPGLEIDVQEGPHILVLGNRAAIEVLRGRLQPHLTPDTFCSMAELFAKQAGLDCLTICAHPFRPHRNIHNIAPELWPGFHAVDLNATDLFNFGAEMRIQVEEFAAAYHLPVLAGSDTHHFEQLGSVYNQFRQPFSTIPELKALISTGAYTVCVNDNLPAMVGLARQEKLRLKQEKLDPTPL